MSGKLAADAIEALRWWETARRWLGKVGLLVIGCAIVVIASYCTGRHDGTAATKAKMADSLRRVLADSSRIIEERLAQRAPIIQQASARVDTVRVRYTDAKAHVIVVSDTTLRIDSLVVPTMPPIAERIRSSDSLVVALDSLNKLQAAHLVDLQLDRNAWRSRALLDEANGHHSRFGFKTGAAAGAAVVLALLHFLR